MPKRVAVVLMLILSGSVLFVEVAQAAPLGDLIQPAGSAMGTCFSSDVIVQATSDPTTPYSIPRAGSVTSWQYNPTGSAAGQPITLVVLKPTSSTTYTVVGTDPQTLPTPLPTNQILNFTVAHPITVSGGETLGLWTGAVTGGALCFWDVGSTPTGDTLQSLPLTGTPAAGNMLTSNADSGAKYTLDLGVTFSPQYDPAVRTGESPAPATTGKFALLSSSVTNNGPGSGGATFTDAVSSAFTINSASAGSGTCGVSAQTVSCAVTGLASGQSAPVNIVVTPKTAGTYTNSVSIAPTQGDPDPNSANNKASNTFKVVSAPRPPKCLVPKLAGTPKGVATKVLGLLNCKVKVRSSHSTKYHKGTVIRSKPGSGKYAAKKSITVFVSSGPPPKKNKHKH